MKATKIRIHNKKIKIIAIIIVVLIASRIALPYVVLHYANKSLANLKSLYGHIDDIDIALYRGAYKINDIYLNKKDSVSGNQTKFFKCDVIDLSVEWSALFKGRFVGELVFERPFLIFTKDKANQFYKEWIDLLVNRYREETRFINWPGWMDTELIRPVEKVPGEPYELPG